MLNYEYNVTVVQNLRAVIYYPLTLYVIFKVEIYLYHKFIETHTNAMDFVESMLGSIRVCKRAHESSIHFLLLLRNSVVDLGFDITFPITQLRTIT